jgi:hypothetical protein
MREIRMGDDRSFPIDAGHTQDKLKALDESYYRLHIAARFLIWLAVAICARILIECLIGFWMGSPSPALYRRVADPLIVEWFTLSLGVLAKVHFEAFKRDEKIRDSVFEFWSKTKSKHNEQRKRVAAIVAGMLVARDINATEILSNVNSESSQRTIATAMTRAQLILARMADSQ